MYHPKERYNAKARQSSASHKKKGKRKKGGADDSTHIQEFDVNAEIIVPKSQEQKEEDRKERLKQEVRRPCVVW